MYKLITFHSFFFGHRVLLMTQIAVDISTTTNNQCVTVIKGIFVFKILSVTLQGVHTETLGK